MAEFPPIGPALPPEHKEAAAKAEPASVPVALSAMGAAAAPLLRPQPPVREGHNVSEATRADMAAYLVMDLKQLKQAKAKLAASASSAILGAVASAKKEELQMLDHLIRIKEACQHGTITDKTPEEIAELCHSLVVMGAKEPIMDFGINLETVLSQCKDLAPEQRVAVFAAYFGQDQTYSQDERMYVTAAIERRLFDTFANEAVAAAKTKPEASSLPALHNFYVLCPSLSGEIGIDPARLKGVKGAISDISGHILDECYRVFQGAQASSAQDRARVYNNLAVAVKYGAPEARDAAFLYKNANKSVDHDGLAPQIVKEAYDRLVWVLGGTDELARKREALPRDIGIGAGILRGIRLFRAASTQRAIHAGTGVLNSLQTILDAVGPRTPEENEAVSQEIRLLDQDPTFQAILEANPLLKDRYVQLKSRHSSAGEPSAPVSAPDAAQGRKAAFKTEIGKIARFLGHIGILAFVTPQRAQQACAVVVSRLERAVSELPESVLTSQEIADLDTAVKVLEAEISAFHEDPHFSQIVRSNELLQARFADLESQVTELRNALALGEEAQKATTLSSKAQIAMKIEHFAPTSARAVLRKEALINQYGPEKVRREAIAALEKEPITLEELESLYYELDPIQESGLFGNEDFHRMLSDLRTGLRGRFFPAFAYEMNKKLGELPEAEDTKPEDLERLCAEADALKDRMDRLSGSSEFTTWLSDQGKGEEFARNVKGINDKAVLYHEALELKKIEGRTQKEHLSLFEWAGIVKDLQELKTETPFGNKKKEGLLRTSDLGGKISGWAKSVSKATLDGEGKDVDYWHACFNEIKKVEELGVQLTEEQRRDLQVCKNRLCELSVAASVKFLQHNVLRGFIPGTELNERVSKQMDVLASNPDFRKILADRGDLKRGYRDVLQQRSKASKTDQAVAFALAELKARAGDPKNVSAVIKDMTAFRNWCREDSEAQACATRLKSDLDEIVNRCMAALGASIDATQDPESLFFLALYINQLASNIPWSSKKFLQDCGNLKVQCFRKMNESINAEVEKSGGGSVQTLPAVLDRCLRLMEMGHGLGSLDAYSKQAIDVWIQRITGLASGVDASDPLETRQAISRGLRSLQPHSGNRIICLNVDQNREVELALQRLAILEAPDPVPIDSALELAFGVSFLERNIPKPRVLQPQLDQARGGAIVAIEQSLYTLEFMKPEDRASILKVLSWDPRATISDVAVLIRNKDKLPLELMKAFPAKTGSKEQYAMNRDETILEHINAMDLRGELQDADFVALEGFFETLNNPSLVNDLVGLGGGGTTSFRLKQQVAERTVWQHKPEVSKVRRIGAWYDSQVAMAEADEKSAKTLARRDRKEYSGEDLRTIPKIHVPSEFRGIDSKHLVGKDEKQGKLPTAIVASRLVSPQIISHLIRDQVDTAIGTKAAPPSGDGRTPEWSVTNMESISALFFTEFGVGEARASVFHQGAVDTYPEGQVRKIVVARNLQPDAEVGVRNISREGTVPVFLMLAALGDTRIEVHERPDVQVATLEERLRWTEKDRQKYDEELLKQYIYDLYPGHIRPAASEVLPKDILSIDEANSLMERMIQEGASAKEIEEGVKDKYIQVGGRLVSLAVYFKTAVIQTRNYHTAAESFGEYMCPLMPPSIFALKRGDPTFHNRLSCLAYQFIGPEKMENLRVLVPNTHGDEGCLALYRRVFRGKKNTTIIPMTDLYDRKGKMNEKRAIGLLIQQTNSDAIGDNFNHEKGAGSLEAVVGQNVRAGFGPKNPHRMEQVQYV